MHKRRPLCLKANAILPNRKNLFCTIWGDFSIVGCGGGGQILSLDLDAFLGKGVQSSKAKVEMNVVSRGAVAECGFRTATGKKSKKTHFLLSRKLLIATRWTLESFFFLSGKKRPKKRNGLVVCYFLLHLHSFWISGSDWKQGKKFIYLRRSNLVARL